MMEPIFASPRANMENPVAMVHDWLNGMRGGEHVLQDLCALFPMADIHTLFYEPQRINVRLNRRRIFPSPLQKIPFSRRYYHTMLPLFPWAMSRMQLEGYKLVISVSHCAAKSAPVPEGVPHLCYCLTPVRCLYERANREHEQAKTPLALLRSHMRQRLRKWDCQTNAKVTRFIAISHFVAQRIRQHYGREAEVIYPAVNVDYSHPAPVFNHQRQDFYLTVCSGLPYKRLDIIVEAFNRFHKPLVIVGNGPEMPYLEKHARHNITFIRWAGKQDLLHMYRHARAFIYAAEEDLGITPIEAQACECPVIAYGSGGCTETVIDGKTGVLYPEQTVDSLLEALENFDPHGYDSWEIRKNAERFSTPRFYQEFRKVVEETLWQNVSRSEGAPQP